MGFNEGVTQSATLSITDSIEVGISVSMTVEVPLVMKSTFTESFKTTHSQTNTNTKTQSQSYSESVNVKIAPRKTMRATMIVTKQTVAGDWSTVAHLPGYTKLWCNDRVDGHYEWFVPAGVFLPQAYPDNCNGDTCQMNGKFKGWHGVGANIQYKECPLHARGSDCE